jgi:hypothetical protein
MVDNKYIFIYDFANIFSQSVAFYFHFLTMSLTEQRILFCRKFTMSMFSFMDHTFSIVSKKHSPNQGQLDMFPGYLLVLFFHLLIFFSNC